MLKMVMTSIVVASAMACGSDEGTQVAPVSPVAGAAPTVAGSGGGGTPAAVSGSNPALWPSTTGACQGKPGMMRGKSTQTLMAAGSNI